MSIIHYYTLKVVTITSIILGAAFAAIDPTTKGYIIAGCIAAIPPTITGIMNHWKIASVEKKVDGMNATLSADKNRAVSQLSNASQKLSHAEGVKEGSDNERAINKKERLETDKSPTAVTITDESVPVTIVDGKLEDK